MVISMSSDWLVFCVMGNLTSFPLPFQKGRTTLGAQLYHIREVGPSITYFNMHSLVSPAFIPCFKNTTKRIIEGWKYLASKAPQLMCHCVNS